MRRLRAREDIEVLLGHGDPMSAGTSYGLLSQALRRLCGVVDGTAPAVQQARLLERVGRHVEAAAARRVAEFLGEMCGIPFDDGSPELRAARGDPLQMSARIAQAFVDLLRAECAAHTVLLVLEDVQWGDALTARLADAALAELRDQPLMVLALGRPELAELFPGLWDRHGPQRLDLRGLSHRACERLVVQVLGARLTSGQIRRLVEHSAGNALYLEELIRAAAQGKLDELPGALIAMLQARLLRLEEGARRALLAASVFGETFCKGETIRRRRNKVEWLRNFSCCVWQLHGKRGEAGEAVRGHGRAPVPVLAVAGRQGRGFGSLRRGQALGALVVHHPAARQGGTRRCRRRAHGAGADRRGPSSRRGRRTGGRSTPSRRRGRRARARGRRRPPRHARGRRRCRGGRRPARLVALHVAERRSDADNEQLGGKRGVVAHLVEHRSGAGDEEGGRELGAARSAAPVVEAEPHAGSTVPPPSSSAIVRGAADFWAGAVRHPPG
ncbi:hypothetical protein [Sorangium sp. So ce1389]|uniref:hypothetical protein n=1 Tax=Sorangium sp. So ce1389 TaxID=3133336 RepID=UPI003F5E9468